MRNTGRRGRSSGGGTVSSTESTTYGTSNDASDSANAGTGSDRSRSSAA